MSNVPASKREVSSIEYVANAAKLFSYTLDCAQKLPKRWMFLLTERMVDMAAKVLEHAKAANSVYVTCATDANLRRYHQMQAYCCAQALSSYVDEAYRRFPAREDSGKPCISQSGYMAWIECIDREFVLLKGVMRSDKQRHGKYFDGPGKGLDVVGVQLGLFDI